jgi:hypothetical protein
MDRVTVEIRDLMEVLVLDQLKPEMVTETQETDHQKLETEMEAPGTDLLKPETEMEAPGTDHQKLVMVMVATEMVAETVAETNPWKNQAVVK